MNDPKVKQQIANKIKDASNILVTVSKNPSVDELSAALGLTLLLNKMDKHATAVFSGEVPPAITFLDPEKTFEETTDSLRDFIIALDKEKADHLRYKLEGDLVKIYITPYRTTITSDDLEFSQGDYNVELVIALGVEDKNDLDAALDGHGKILHNATVATATAGEQTSKLGSIDWHESNASSLSEMLVTLYDALKLDKQTLDKSISTAWMTGIVAATERFSNPRTSSKVMTIAAQLMSAGADQQLIATKLEEAAVKEEDTSGPADKDGRTDLAEGKAARLDNTKAAAKEEAPRPDGELVIHHEKNDAALDEAARISEAARLKEAAKAAEQALEKQRELSAEQEEPVVDQEEAEPALSPEPALESASEPLPENTPEAQAEEPKAPASHGPVDYQPPVANPFTKPESETNNPMFGGTLNATSEQAQADKRRELEADKNKVILSHGGYIGSQQGTHNSTVNSASDSQSDTPPAVDVFKDGGPLTSSPVEPPSAPTVAVRDITPPSEALPPAPSEPNLPPAPEPAFPAPVEAPVVQPGSTLADLDSMHRAPKDEALAAVEAALSSAPAPEPAPAPAPPVEVPVIPPIPTPSASPTGMPLPPPPPVPDFGNQGMPPLPPVSNSGLPPERLGDIFAPEQQPTLPQPAAPSDPGQFQIPGQN